MIVRRRKIFFLRRTVYAALYVAPDYFIELVCRDLKNNFAAAAGAKKGLYTAATG